MPADVHAIDDVFAMELNRLRDSHLLRDRRTLRPIDAVSRRTKRPAARQLRVQQLPRAHASSSRDRGDEISVRALRCRQRGGWAGHRIHRCARLGRERDCELEGHASAVLLPSGYQANHAVVQTLAGLADRAGGVRFLIDKFVHASLVDAVRGSGLPFRVFPHNSLAKLRRLLEDNDEGGLQVIITESIFSMDGDAADLAGLAELKQEFPFMLVLDEAHGEGVYGNGGAGLASELGLQNAVDVSIATLSKAVGCIGGAVCASRAFCEALINFGRAYIFSTSVPPFVAAAAEAAVGVMRRATSANACVHNWPHRYANV